MALRKIRVHSAARRELLAAAALIDVDRPGWGKKLREEYQRKLAQIRRFPRSGVGIAVPGGHDVQRFGLRKFEYSIILLTLGETLTIVAFAHQKQRPGYWLDRMDSSLDL